MITPLDIENKKFSKQMMNGYSVEEVDDFLDDLTVDYSKNYKEITELKNKVEEYGVKVYIDHEVLEIKPFNNKYKISTRYNDFVADYVIIASGSKAQIKNYNDSFIIS